jgi:energy-coupling factor transport system ATP-binding protein
VTLALRGVRYRYAGAAAAALEGVSLTLEPGRVLGVVGPNGAGKSTLCLVAAGLAPATIGGELAGEVRIDGMTTASSRPHELAQRCGILFQNPTTQLSGTSATVWEEVAFGPRNLGLPLEEVVARVDAALDALTIRPLADRDPERLSGGQAQLVALAGVLVVEHKTDLLATIAEEVAVLVGGSVVASDEAANILADARLEAWGIEPPSRIRIERAARRAGVHLASEVEA